MDIYDRTDWQMSDHDSYELYPLDWPENVFGEELPSDDDEVAEDDTAETDEAPEPPSTDEDDNEAKEGAD